jgi:hypothetical protein
MSPLLHSAKDGKYIVKVMSYDVIVTDLVLSAPVSVRVSTVRNSGQNVFSMRRTSSGPVVSDANYQITSPSYSKFHWVSLSLKIIHRSVNIRPVRLSATEFTALSSQYPEPGILWNSMKCLVGLMNCLDHFFPKNWLFTPGLIKGEQQIIYYRFYVVCRKDVIAYLAPDLRSVLVLLEHFCQNTYATFLRDGDIIFKKSGREETLVTILRFYQELISLRNSQLLNKSSVDDILFILKHWMQVACGRFFSFNPRKDVPTNSHIDDVLAAIVDSVPDISPCLPPRLRGHYIKSGLFEYQQSRQTAVGLIHRPCFLDRHSRTERQAAPLADECFCGWLVDSIPSQVLEFFDHSRELLAGCLHDEAWVVELGSRTFGSHTFGSHTFGSDARACGKGLFPLTDIVELLLKQRIFILFKAMTLALQSAFWILEQLISHKPPTIAHEESCKRVFEQRQAVLFEVINRMLVFSSDFWNWSRRDLQEVHNFDMLDIEFAEFAGSLQPSNTALLQLTESLYIIYSQNQCLVTGCIGKYI